MKQNSVSPNNNLLHSGVAPPFDSSSNQYLHNHLHPSPYFGNTNVQDIPKNSNNIGHDAYPRIVKTEINDHIVNYMATGSKRKLLFSKKKENQEPSNINNNISNNGNNETTNIESCDSNDALYPSVLLFLQKKKQERNDLLDTEIANNSQDCLGLLMDFDKD